MIKPSRFIIVLAAVGVCCGWTAAMAQAAPPDTQPATRPTTSPHPLTREAKRTRLLNDLRGEYNKMLGDRDWTVRSFAVMGLARLPGAEISAPLLGSLLNDKNDIVRMIAWQALLARAPTLSEEETTQWIRETYALAESGAFKGDLRIPLLKFLATQPAEKRSRALFMRLFDESNNRIKSETAAIKGMGELLDVWKSPELAEQLIAKMASLNDAWRAEAVLRAMGSAGPAGAGIAPASDLRRQGSDAMWQTTQKAYSAWRREARSGWQKNGGSGLAKIKGLSPHHIAAPVALEEIDPDDVRWQRELALSWPRIRSFDLAFALDATGSMFDIHEWLRRDIKCMLRTLALVSAEPRIGITFYRDHGDEFVTRVLPLTDKPDTLVAALTQTRTKGGGDIPEAVKEALDACIKASRWHQTPLAPKIIVLVGDSPPHRSTEDDCLKTAAVAAEKGFRIYAIKVQGDDDRDSLEIFSQIAAAGKGSSFAATPTDEPGTRLLTAILLDLVSRDDRDRVEPWIHVILEMQAEPIPETHRAFGAFAPPPVRPRPEGRER